MSAFRHPTKPPAAAADRRRWAVRVLVTCLAVTIGICVAIFTQPSVQAPDARVAPGSISSTPGVAPLRPSAAGSQPANTSNAKNVYISPRFFGQHLMFFGLLTPDIPVHAMRLWDSNTGWCHIDRGTASDRYDFGQLDALLAQASRVGADVEYAFGNTPSWAADGSYPQSSVSNQCSPSSQAKAPANESYWKSFVTALATHAKGRIHAYELWNEFDLANYWSGDTMQMVRMSVDAASIIHKVDPSAVVLSPSVTDSPVGYATLNQYMSALPAGTIDAIAMHSYTNGQWPEDSVPAEMAAVRQALPAAYSHTPVWSTEGGWGKDSTFSTDASDQRAFVARFNLLMLMSGAVRSYWYAYPNTQWGTLSAGAQLTPAGTAMSTVESWLSGAVLAGCSTADGNLWTCDLTTGAPKKARIVWAKTTPVSGYPTTGYATVKTLDGKSSPTGGQSITLTSEPVLLSS